MNWREFLKNEIQSVYRTTEGLVTLVEDRSLAWKPSTGSNWMTTGQLLNHITQACGTGFRGFVAGDWGLPEGMDFGDLPPEEQLPPAEKLPAIASVAEAQRLLREDQQLALEMLAACGDAELANKIAPAPWDARQLVLGHRLLQMVDHLKQHKGQLFYYLKLQGKPVNTGDLWGV
jgi:uncharacterized damage-inducible protein DinB